MRVRDDPAHKAYYDGTSGGAKVRSRPCARRSTASIATWPTAWAAAQMAQRGLGLVNRTQELERFFIARALGMEGELPKVARHPREASV